MLCGDYSALNTLPQSHHMCCHGFISLFNWPSNIIQPWAIDMWGLVWSPVMTLNVLFQCVTYAQLSARNLHHILNVLFATAVSLCDVRICMPSLTKLFSSLPTENDLYRNMHCSSTVDYRHCFGCVSQLMLESAWPTESPSWLRLKLGCCSMYACVKRKDDNSSFLDTSISFCQHLGFSWRGCLQAPRAWFLQVWLLRLCADLACFGISISWRATSGFKQHSFIYHFSLLSMCIILRSIIGLHLALAEYDPWFYKLISSRWIQVKFCSDFSIFINHFKINYSPIPSSLFPILLLYLFFYPVFQSFFPLFSLFSLCQCLSQTIRHSLCKWPSKFY